MWRTSWLSREVIVLPALMGIVFLFGAAHLVGWQPVLVTLPSGIAIDATVLLGVLGTLLAFALFLCTAMIYACLPFLREWASPLTVINYTLLGGASGFTLAAAFAGRVAPDLVRFLAGWAFVITLLGLASRIASLVRNSRLRPKSTLQTAIGIKHPQIAQKSMGFMGGSFNTREFFHGQPGFTLRRIKWTFLLAAFAVPLGLQGASWWGAPQPLLAPGVRRPVPRTAGRALVLLRRGEPSAEPLLPGRGMKLTRIKFFLPEVPIVMRSASNDMTGVPGGVLPQRARPDLTGTGAQHAAG